ncbi:LOG family protein [Nocardioides sp.]|uniref:LOG family protein n=1 Tax=Nocardioides sp. TaxID=35761 RepID=UPI003562E50C
MKRTHGRLVHVDTLAEFDRRMAAGASNLSGWRIQGVDLTDRSSDLARCRVGGATFLGCRLSSDTAASVRAGGALVLPVIPDVPIDTYRSRLYTADELYDTVSYADSLDARAYAWSMQDPRDLSASVEEEATLARSLHDHAVDRALRSWVSGRRVVGVMGGHALRRGEAGYADAARLGRLLARHAVVATGGGPGAMEAANLGAWLAGRPAAELDEALSMLAVVPTYRPSIDAWAAAAFRVREHFAGGVESLAIPTWHYGHEPPNVLATALAKYFRNATREAVLLEVCDAGIVFLPGAAGTVQEIFQDACENYYADESSLAPMILVGRTHWTEDLPAWPLLQALARERTMAPMVHLVDTVEEAAALLAA